MSKSNPVVGIGIVGALGAIGYYLYKTGALVGWLQSLTRHTSAPFTVSQPGVSLGGDGTNPFSGPSAGTFAEIFNLQRSFNPVDNIKPPAVLMDAPADGKNPFQIQTGIGVG